MKRIKQWFYAFFGARKDIDNPALKFDKQVVLDHDEMIKLINRICGKYRKPLRELKFPKPPQQSRDTPSKQ